MTQHFPLPDPEHGPFTPLWKAAGEGQFALPRCRSCGKLDWYPRGECRRCGGDDIEWTVLSGRGELFSWAIVHRALDPRLADIAPYISAIVTLEEDPDCRFVTRIIDCDEQHLRAGLAVAARFADLGYPGLIIGTIAPLFTPVDLRRGAR